MSTELIVISGLGVTILSVGIALAALILNGHRSLRGEIKGLREEVNDLREEVNHLRERMAHLEGLLEGLREAISGRRVAAVADDPGRYDQR